MKNYKILSFLNKLICYKQISQIFHKIKKMIPMQLVLKLKIQELLIL